MRVNILFDERRVERYEPLMSELRRQHIDDYEIWPCVFHKGPVYESINLSQKMIVQKAKERGDKECVIFEDDIWFPSEDGWVYFLGNKPDSYDIYIGGSYLMDNRIEYKFPRVAVKEYVGNHCIIIHQRYYDTFLSVPQNAHIDQAQNGLGEFYLCYPMAALQRPGFSSNTGDMANYNAILQEKDVYGKFR